MSDNSTYRLEEMTKEQLIAELNVATEKLDYYRSEEVKLKIRLDDVCGRLEAFEKKREFERCLAEATDFLKANGYEVRQMSAAERFPVEEGFQTLPGGVQVRKPERVWRDEQMIRFAQCAIANHAIGFKGLVDLNADLLNFQP